MAKKNVSESRRLKSTDLFKMIQTIAGRRLSDDEVDAVADSCVEFVRENYAPDDVYDPKTLKELFADDDDDDGDNAYGKGWDDDDEEDNSRDCGYRYDRDGEPEDGMEDY